MDDIELLDAVMLGFGLKTDSEFADYMGVDQSSISNIRSGKQRMGIILKLRLIDKWGYLATSSLVESITPKAISQRIRRFNKQNAQRIARANRTESIEDNLETMPSDEIAKFIQETLSENSSDKAKDITMALENLLSKLSKGEAFTFSDRVLVVEGLNAMDKDLWPFTVKGITKYCASDDELVAELQRLSEATFLEKFKRISGSKSDKELAGTLGVTSQTISALRKDPKKLGSPTGLKILYAMGQQNVVTDFDTQELKQLLDDNQLLYRHLKQQAT